LTRSRARLTLATQPYDDGRVQPGDDIPTIKELLTTSFPWILQCHAQHRLQQPLL
jgi:hypothetical protein